MTQIGGKDGLMGTMMMTALPRSEDGGRIGSVDVEKVLTVAAIIRLQKQTLSNELRTVTHVYHAAIGHFHFFVLHYITFSFLLSIYPEVMALKL